MERVGGALPVDADEMGVALGFMMLSEAGGMHGPMAPMDDGPAPLSAGGGAVGHHGGDGGGSGGCGGNVIEPPKKKEARAMAPGELARIAKSKADSAARKAAKAEKNNNKKVPKGANAGHCRCGGKVKQPQPPPQ